MADPADPPTVYRPTQPCGEFCPLLGIVGGSGAFCGLALHHDDDHEVIITIAKPPLRFAIRWRQGNGEGR